MGGYNNNNDINNCPSMAQLSPSLLEAIFHYNLNQKVFEPQHSHSDSMGTPHPSTSCLEEGNKHRHFPMLLCKLYHPGISAGVEKEGGHCLPVSLQGGKQGRQ